DAGDRVLALAGGVGAAELVALRLDIGGRQHNRGRRGLGRHNGRSAGLLKGLAQAAEPLQALAARPLASATPLPRLIVVRVVFVGHAYALTFLRFIAAISSFSGACAACGCSGPA